MAEKIAGTRKKTASKTIKPQIPKKVQGRGKKILLSQSEFADYVRERAYYIWQETGKPEGSDREIWLKAERDINNQYSVQ